MRTFLCDTGRAGRADCGAGLVARPEGVLREDGGGAREEMEGVEADEGRGAPLRWTGGGDVGVLCLEERRGGLEDIIKGVS